MGLRSTLKEGERTPLPLEGGVEMMAACPMGDRAANLQKKMVCILNTLRHQLTPTQALCAIRNARVYTTQYQFYDLRTAGHSSIHRS